MARSALAIIFILGIIIGIIGYGNYRTDNLNVTQHIESIDPPDEAGIEIEMHEHEKVIIECEDPDTSKWENKDPIQNKEILIIRKEPHNKNLGYLEIPDGWIAGCYDNRKGTGGQLPGKAYYHFEIKTEGDYHLFLRAKWYDNCGDSVWVRFNKGKYLSIDDTEGKISERTYRWAWHPLRNKGDFMTVHLTAGKHTLELNTKEDGPKFDKFLLTTEPNMPTRDNVNP